MARRLPTDDVIFIRKSFVRRVIENIESCLMEGLMICEEKTISHIFKLLFQFFQRELNCISVAPAPVFIYLFIYLSSI